MKLLIHLFLIVALSQTIVASVVTPNQVKNIFHDLPTYDTKRLILRPFQVSDVDDLWLIYSSPLATEYLHYNPYPTKELVTQRVEEILELYHQKKPAQWVMVLKESSKVIGFCGFIDVNFQHAFGEISGVLHPEYWGQGLMKEASILVAWVGFCIMNLNKIKSCVNADNQASIRMHEKEGNFVCEGVLRQEEYKNGNYYDLVVYSMLREEFFLQQDYQGNI